MIYADTRKVVGDHRSPIGTTPEEWAWQFLKEYRPDEYPLTPAERHRIVARWFRQAMDAAR